MRCIRKVKLPMLLVTLMVLSGCAGGWGMHSNSSDGVTLIGSREGVQALGRMIHGSKEKESPYWALQHKEEEVNSLKYVIKGGPNNADK